MGQTQPKSVVQRIEEAAERRLQGKTEDVSVLATPVVTPTVPAVDGSDVATGTDTHISTKLSAEVTPQETNTAEAAPVTDISLLRDQLEQVVTNFRSRLDSHEGLITDLQSVYKTVTAEIEDHKASIDALVTALESIK